MLIPEAGLTRRKLECISGSVPDEKYEAEVITTGHRVAGIVKELSEIGFFDDDAQAASTPGDTMEKIGRA